MARCCCKPVLFLGSTLHILCAIGCATATITAIWAIHLYDPLSILTHQYFYIIPHVQHVTTYSRSKEKNNNDSNNDNGDLFTLNAFVGARKWILKWYIAIQFDHKLDICTGVYSPYVNLYKCKITKINEYIIYIYIRLLYIYTQTCRFRTLTGAATTQYCSTALFRRATKEPYNSPMFDQSVPPPVVTERSRFVPGYYQNEYPDPGN